MNLGDLAVFTGGPFTGGPGQVFLQISASLITSDMVKELWLSSESELFSAPDAGSSLDLVSTLSSESEAEVSLSELALELALNLTS